LRRLKGIVQPGQERSERQSHDTVPVGVDLFLLD
jgi:hypothetical protein